jgi:hypothetical protein
MQYTSGVSDDALSSPDDGESGVAINISLAEHFLRALDPTTDRFEFRTFSDRKDGPGSKVNALKLSGTLREHADQLARLNQAGAGIFVVVNSGGQKTAEIDRVRALFVDLDGSPLQPILDAKFQPQIIVESSPLRFHAYWLVHGMPLEQFSAVQRDLADRFESDRNVCDLPRVMRLPGFLHQKDKPWLVKPIVIRDHPPYAAESFLRKHERTKLEVAAGGERWISDETYEDLRSALRTFDADSYAAWAAMLLHLKELGARGLSLWLEWSATSEKFDEKEALSKWKASGTPTTGYEAVFSAAQKAGWRNPRAKVGPLAIVDDGRRHIIKFTRFGELKPTPIDWLIEGWLPKNSLASLVAQPGLGKTLLALDWSASIAAGRTWIGHVVTRGAVFYMPGEGRSGIANRLTAWEIARGQSLQDAPLFISDGLPPLCDENNVREIVETVEGHVAAYGPPALIVVDTLARAFGGENENDTAAMNRYVFALDQMRRKFGSTVLSLHHTGYENRPTGRGSTALIGAMDASMYLKRSKFGGVELTSEKEKDWEKPAQKDLSLVQVELPVLDSRGAPIKSVVLTPLLEAITRGEKTEANMDATRETALASYLSGVSPKEIASQLNVGRSTVQDWARDAGISRRPGRPRKKAQKASMASTLDKDQSPMPGPIGPEAIG